VVASVLACGPRLRPQLLSVALRAQPGIGPYPFRWSASLRPVLSRGLRAGHKFFPFPSVRARCAAVVAVPFVVVLSRTCGRPRLTAVRGVVGARGVGADSGGRAPAWTSSSSMHRRRWRLTRLAGPLNRLSHQRNRSPPFHLPHLDAFVCPINSPHVPFLANLYFSPLFTHCPFLGQPACPDPVVQPSRRPKSPRCWIWCADTPPLAPTINHLRLFFDLTSFPPISYPIPFHLPFRSEHFFLLSFSLASPLTLYIGPRSFCLLFSPPSFLSAFTLVSSVRPLVPCLTVWAGAASGFPPPGVAPSNR